MIGRYHAWKFIHRSNFLFPAISFRRIELDGLAPRTAKILAAFHVREILAEIEAQPARGFFWASRACLAASLANPSTILELLSTASGQSFAAAFRINSKSSSLNRTLI